MQGVEEAERKQVERRKIICEHQRDTLVARREEKGTWEGRGKVLLYPKDKGNGQMVRGMMPTGR